jgi:formate/nitrite transporter FocA (FNT family)
MIKKYLKNFWSAVLAGMAISVGCIVFLSVENKNIGSLLFAVGLLTILAFKLNLFTGKAPYICENKPSYCGFAGVVWLGNFVGTALSALVIRYTRIYNNIIDRCTTIANAKASDSLISLFVLGMFCGMLMYIAVDTFNKQSLDKNFSATVQTILCVSVFILSNFEHSVADIFYFMLALPIEQWILPLIVITFGNIVGGNIFCFSNKIIKEAP